MLENHMIQCKRAYESPAPDDGQRVLVDRLWPRNCRKEALKLDQWHKELAPSTELRRAFKSGELTFEAFRERYRQELAAHPEYWWPLLGIAERERVTLIYAAHDERENNAQVLAEWLEEQLDRQDRQSSPTCYAGERLS